MGEGAWAQLPGGGCAWRLRIASPGARSQVLVFRRAWFSCCCLGLRGVGQRGPGACSWGRARVAAAHGLLGTTWVEG